MSRATAHCYLITLRAANLLACEPARGVYPLGVKMLDYATVVHESALFTTTMAVPVLVDDVLVGVIATLAFQTTDAVEGMTAFLEKRKPIFRDG